jgi:hypothetical protein
METTVKRSAVVTEVYCIKNGKDSGSFPFSQGFCYIRLRKTREIIGVLALQLKRSYRKVHQGSNLWDCCQATILPDYDIVETSSSEDLNKIRLWNRDPEPKAKICSPKRHGEAKEFTICEGGKLVDFYLEVVEDLEDLYQILKQLQPAANPFELRWGGEWEITEYSGYSQDGQKDQDGNILCHLGTRTFLWNPQTNEVVFPQPKSFRRKAVKSRLDNEEGAALAAKFLVEEEEA